MNKKIFICFTVALAFVSLLILNGQLREVKIREENVTVAYVFGEPIYARYREVIVNSSGVCYLSLDKLMKSDGSLKRHFILIFEACGDLTPNKPFEFRRSLIIDATKNITRLKFECGKFLYEVKGSIGKAPDWVSCIVRITGEGVERVARNVDGVVVWNDTVDLPPGVYRVDVSIYGVPMDKLENVRFKILLDVGYEISKDTLYDLRYGFKENLLWLVEDFNSLNNWSVEKRESAGYAKIVDRFNGRSGVLVLKDSVVKYKDEIRIKPPFRMDVGMYLPHTCYGILSFGFNGGDNLEIMFDMEEGKVSLYMSTVCLNETGRFGKFCWDRIDRGIEIGWHDLSIDVDDNGNTSFYIDGKFAGSMKLRLKGIRGELRIFASSMLDGLGVDYVRIYKL